MVGFSIGYNLGLSAPGHGIEPVPLDPLTETLISAMDVEPSAQRKRVINDLMLAAVSTGVLAKFSRLYIKAAHHEQAGRLNWKNSAVGLLTPVALGTGAGPTFVADSGFTGGANSGVFDTGFDPTIDPGSAGNPMDVNAAHIGVYYTVGASAVNAAYGCGNLNCMMSARQADNSAIVRLNTATQTVLPVGVSAAGNRHFIGQRTAADASYFYVEAENKTDPAVTQASTSMSAMTFATCGRKSANTPTYQPDSRRQGAVHWGEALSPAEITAWNAALHQYMTAIGAHT